MLESDYIHARPPKPPPPLPVRVSCSSQLIAALRQHARPIVIEDQELAAPFARLLRARELPSLGSSKFVADAMCSAIGRSYGVNIEAHWHMGRYVLPGNVEKVILKPKQRPGFTRRG
jgi:hypothetical protein